MVKVDTAAVSWDAKKRHWLIRLQVGEEVIKRVAAKTAREADDESLRSLAVRTAKDEGYDLDAPRVTVSR